MRQGQARTASEAIGWESAETLGAEREADIGARYEKHGDLAQAEVSYRTAADQHANTEAEIREHVKSGGVPKAEVGAYVAAAKAHGSAARAVTRAAERVKAGIGTAADKGPLSDDTDLFAE